MVSRIPLITYKLFSHEFHELPGIPEIPGNPPIPVFRGIPGFRANGSNGIARKKCLISRIFSIKSELKLIKINYLAQKS